MWYHHENIQNEKENQFLWLPPQLQKLQINFENKENQFRTKIEENYCRKVVRAAITSFALSR